MSLFNCKSTFYIAIFLIINIFSSKAQSFTFFKNGRTDYDIVINHQKNIKELKAANILNDYLKKISGAYFEIKVLSKKTDQKIIQLTHVPFTKDGSNKIGNKSEEGTFSISIKADKIDIIGIGKGLDYGVYSFLEHLLGCRYYAKDGLYLPDLKEFSLPSDYFMTYSPLIDFRLNYNYEAFQDGYPQWHKLSNIPGENNLTKKSDWGMWVHTLFTLLPPKDYFQTNPEYFSLRNGVRTPDQLCLSNKAVLKIVIDSLQSQINRNPSAKYWSVSQMDNYNFCECDACKKIDKKEGSPSGSLLQFVNNVAAAFPNKIISTLAYQYSRKAPKNIQPLQNVNIMLCTIECDRSKPIDSDTTMGSFYDDLKQWSALTKDIIIWDYVINFNNLCSPFPNLPVLQPNLQFFTKFGVKMDFQQGLTGNGGELKELRAYLISKLLWNPNVNVDSIRQDFLLGYYGAAGVFVDSILNEMNRSLAVSKQPLLIYEHPFAHANDYLSPNNLKKYFDWIEKAKIAISNNEVIKIRIDRFTQPFRFAALEVAKAKVNSPDWLFEKKFGKEYVVKPYYEQLLATFIEKCGIYGPTKLHETKTPPAEYAAAMQNYFKNGVEQHLAVGSRIQFEHPYAEKYKANGNESLIDGIHGFDKWETLWQGWNGVDMVATIDLGAEKEIKLLKINCMDDNQSWILAPESVAFEISLDGKNYLPIGLVKNEKAGLQIDKQIVPFQYELTQPSQTRFIRVTAKNIENIPKWRGVEGKAWLFVDEIVVK